MPKLLINSGCNHPWRDPGCGKRKAIVTAAKSPRIKPFRRTQVQNPAAQDVRKPGVCKGAVMGGNGKVKGDW